MSRDKTPPKRGMDAVISKVSGHGRRRAAMRRKGAPMSVMIALGAPPKDDEDGDDEAPASNKAARIAEIEEQIGALRAELALLHGDDADDADAEDENDDSSEEA